MPWNGRETDAMKSDIERLTTKTFVEFWRSLERETARSTNKLPIIPSIPMVIAKEAMTVASV